jgi:hypothetical protein
MARHFSDGRVNVTLATRDKLRDCDTRFGPEYELVD